MNQALRPEAAPSTDTPALRARLRRRIHARLTIDLELAAGPEIVGLFGRSGAGKTSVLRLIAGLERPDDGEVVLDGRTVFRKSPRRWVPLRERGIGLIFQHDLLFPHLDVAANLSFGLKGCPRAEAEARVERVAELCGVTGLLDRRPATLSGGERQRVGLARALAPRPKLLLADEPFSALDLKARDELVDRLRLVQRAERIPVLYVTHSPSEAIALTDRILVIEAGRIIAEGPPLDVLAERAALPGARGTPIEGLRNVFAASIAGHDAGSTRLAIEGGPTLIVPSVDRSVGAPVVVSVRADDIILAREPVAGLSARNLIPGRVDRLVPHGSEVEVVLRSGRTEWLVSLVAGAVEALALQPGAEAFMMIKARGCRVSLDPRRSEPPSGESK